MYGGYKRTFDDFGTKAGPNDVVDGFITGASVFINKNTFLKMPELFDEKYFMYVEDVDLSRKILNENKVLICAEKCIVFHKEGGSLGGGYGRPNLKRFVMWGYYELRNRIYYRKKFYPKCKIKNLLYGFYHFIRRLTGVLIYDTKKKTRIKLLLMAIYDAYNGNMGKNIEVEKLLNRNI